MGDKRGFSRAAEGGKTKNGDVKGIFFHSTDKKSLP